ncbi:hypothetical protein [Pseudomonas sp. MWU12-2345]|uniref:hypothetical protein n=1 Tax=Pseudomonas sp. MWU12-2345 TaxID=2928689 RepID=UPI00200E0D74|nr:hypothetical protein [Pseudomonas sp. MWU12-2345]
MSDIPDTAPAAPAPTPVAAASPKSPYTLTVKFAFADYTVGQLITDPAEVAAVLAGESAANVLKRSA